MNLFDKPSKSISTFPGWEHAALVTVITGGPAIFQGSCPLTGIEVTGGIDMSIHKSLANDFLVSVFGDTLTSITLQGLELLAANSACGGVGGSGSFDSFYNSVKLSADTKKRITIGLAGAGAGSGSYVCIVAGFSRSQTSADVVTGTAKYTLKLLGVRQ